MCQKIFFTVRPLMCPLVVVAATIGLLLPTFEMANGFFVISSATSQRRLSKTWQQQPQQQQQKQQRNTRKNHPAQLSDWLVENLESDEDSITFSSSTKAGENDTLPEQGLQIADFRIFASESPRILLQDNESNTEFPIRLLGGRNGWGTGVHPTTRLCLEWISDNVQGGEVLLDYGCGSGILSIAALHKGASYSIGVDIEAEALVTAERNIEMNDFPAGRFEGFHTREIVPYGLCRPNGVDICVANILIGQLVRSSMVSALSTNISPNGLLCLSGIRPNEVEALKSAYDSSFEWIEDQYSELSAVDCEGSVKSYGFDCGRWSRVVGRRKQENRDMDIRAMSESAVS